MNQLTIRGFDDELTRRIRQLAAREGISLNRAVLRLLRRGAGLGHHKDGGDTVGSSLDHLIGTWTSEEAAEMDRALQDLSHVDEAIGTPHSFERHPDRGAGDGDRGGSRFA